MSPAGATGCFDHERAHLNTLFDLRRWADVVQTGSPMLGTAPDAAVHVLVSHALLQLGRYAVAYRVAQQALARWPTDADACLATVHAELDLGLHAQAERQARAGLHHAPDDARLVAVLGRALLALGQYQAAHAQFANALELNPGAAYYRYLASIALWNLGQHDHARSMLDDALAIDPLDADYLGLRAELERPHNAQRAQELARQALRLNPRLDRAQHLLNRWAHQRLYAALAMGVGWALTAWAQWGADFAGLSGLSGFACLAFAFNAVVAVHLAVKLPKVWLWGFCGVHAVLLNATNTQGLPPMLQAEGARAMFSLEALAFLAGTGIMTVFLVVLTSLLRWLLWGGLTSTWALVQSLWVSRQHRSSGALLRDLLQRRRVQYNGVAGVAMMAGAWLPVHITVLWHAFGLVPMLWVLAKWQLPADHQPPFSVLWLLLGLVPAILWTLAYTHLQTLTAAAYSGFAMLLGVYGAMLANQAQEGG